MVINNNINNNIYATSMILMPFTFYKIHAYYITIVLQINSLIIIKKFSIHI